MYFRQCEILVFADREMAEKFEEIAQMCAIEEFRGYFCLKGQCNTMFAPKELSTLHERKCKCIKECRNKSEKGS